MAGTKEEITQQKEEQRRRTECKNQEGHKTGRTSTDLLNQCQCPLWLAPLYNNFDIPHFASNDGIGFTCRF
ncbi:hypothetical protein EVAR_9616_1 [Eumeta japonica]|uniref:Uncharacterized protein n=1 Tax=Eumeta variegata TaxID=151549 RepID=A0A4C1TMU8_EUMVA|nr:hypothetical protein EVAR_9616_1 [Eumeta japonica]